MSDTFDERRVDAYNAYVSYKNGGVTESRVKDELERLLHTAYKEYAQ